MPVLYCPELAYQRETLRHLVHCMAALFGTLLLTLASMAIQQVPTSMYGGSDEFFISASHPAGGIGSLGPGLRSFRRGWRYLVGGEQRRITGHGGLYHTGQPAECHHAQGPALQDQGCARFAGGHQHRADGASLGIPHGMDDGCRDGQGPDVPDQWYDSSHHSR